MVNTPVLAFSKKIVVYFRYSIKIGYKTNYVKGINKMTPPNLDGVL